MNLAGKRLDLILLAIIVGGYLALASVRLATVPVPDTDESYFLQLSYEMIYRGKLAKPFNRYLGGNIENTFHSFTPAHIVLQTGFLKLFGWGILQGRVFNIIMAALALVMTYLVGRSLFGWRVGLIAIVLLVSDVTFLYRSRFLRNDYSAAMFCMLAYLLYEEAERRKDWRWFIGSGLALGAALMSHTAALYMILAITLLMLLKRGWRIIKDRNFYQVALGAFIVSSYEIIYDIIDFQNVLLQNRGDKLHFKVLSAMGWLKNIRRELRRYEAWYDGSLMHADVSRRLLHLFQFLAVVAFIYLCARAIRHFKRGDGLSEPRVRLLIVSAVTVIFFAAVTSQKAIYYIAHLAPLFAIMAGILIADALDLFSRWRTSERVKWRIPPRVARASLAIGVALVLGYGYAFLKQTKRYLREVRNPDLAMFEEFKTAIRTLVPEGVCSTVVRDPVIWLAFPEHDLCFSNLQTRMKRNVDLDGKEYALIVSPKLARAWLSWVAPNNHHLLGELSNTVYGSYRVYYTGTDPQVISKLPIRYQFFANRSGYASDEQIAQAAEVWSASAEDLKRVAKQGDLTIEPQGLRIDRKQEAAQSGATVQLDSVELKPDSIYQLNIEADYVPGQWDAVVIEDATGIPLSNKKLNERAEKERNGVLFRTGKLSRVRLAVRSIGENSTTPLFISRISVREVLQIHPSN